MYLYVHDLDNNTTLFRYLSAPMAMELSQILKSDALDTVPIFRDSLAGHRRRFAAYLQPQVFFLPF
jgi:hypothetical protein